MNAGSATTCKTNQLLEGLWQLLFLLRFLCCRLCAVHRGTSWWSFLTVLYVAVSVVIIVFFFFIVILWAVVAVARAVAAILLAGFWFGPLSRGRLLDGGFGFGRGGSCLGELPSLACQHVGCYNARVRVGEGRGRSQGREWGRRVKVKEGELVMYCSRRAQVWQNLGNFDRLWAYQRDVGSLSRR